MTLGKQSFLIEFAGEKLIENRKNNQESTPGAIFSS